MGKLPCEYVVDGGTLKCTMGSKTVKIKATNNSNKTAQGKKVCTIADKEAFINVPAFGMCKAGGKLKPCKPALAKWVIPKPKGGNNQSDFLVQRATNTCKLGGKVTIQDSGQKTKPPPKPGEQGWDDKEVKELTDLMNEYQKAHGLTNEQALMHFNAMAGQATDSFQKMIGAKPVTLLGANGSFTNADFNRLQGLIGNHNIRVITDMYGNELMVSHTLAGLVSAVSPLDEAFRETWSGWAAGPADSLYTGTFADIVQSVLDGLGPSTDPSHVFIGPGTEAAFPELISDIDGFILGTDFNTGNFDNASSFGQFLYDYYAGDGVDRFTRINEIFNGLGEDYLFEQGKKFEFLFKNRDTLSGGKLEVLLKGSLKGVEGIDPKSTKEGIEETQEWLKEQEIKAKLNGIETDGTCLPTDKEKRKRASVRKKKMQKHQKMLDDLKKTNMMLDSLQNSMGPGLGGF